MTATLEP